MTKWTRRLITGLALLTMAAPAFAADEITGIQLSPSASVGMGTTVTVTVQGTGQCTVMVETNGASAVEGGFGDYQLGPGPFPMSVSFKAEKVGSFQIAATGSTSENGLCVKGGAFAINTMLEVRGRAVGRDTLKKIHPKPAVKPIPRDPGPRKVKKPVQRTTPRLIEKQ